MTRFFCFTSVLALTASAAAAEMNFNRIASFSVVDNMAEGEDRTRETSAEIIDATDDGMTLVYTDSPLGGIGLIDISDPANPAPLGNVAMDGEPTSVVVIGQTAYVAVNTSESFTNPSGKLAVVDLGGRSVTASCPLGGQPDSIAASKDGSFLSIAIENERDEEAGDGRSGQMPAGFLQMINLAEGSADCESLRSVDLTGLAEVSPEDPEPEFVDINSAGETVVTLQENNHIVVVSKDGQILSDFSAGAVDLNGIDATDERGALIFTETQTARKREPDAVKWIGEQYFATANEGDMDGGSRGWTVFSKDGAEIYESGTAFEQAIIKIGHYPDKRSDAKGVEPESVTVGTYGDTPMVFIGAERASVVGVYDATDPAAPVLKQLLPSGVGPEGYVTIPERNLLVSANETDLGEDGGARAHVMIFEYQNAPAAYPQLTSEGMAELTGWGAISGMVADEDGTIWAVNDSFYGFQPSIFRIDISQSPAKITDAIRVTRAGAPAQKLDMEGITLDGKGGFWVASEGNTEKMIPHALYHISAEGEIEDEIGLPAALLASETRFGFEGITRVGDMLWMPVQREWADDPADHVKLVAYDTVNKTWGAVLYPKATPQTGWVGLSELTAFGDNFYVVERDNQIGAAAVTKKIYRIPATEMVPAEIGTKLPVVSKTELRDLMEDLTTTGGYVLDKVEGLAIQSDGTTWVSTDNDGVDDHSGETMFFSIGAIDAPKS